MGVTFTVHYEASNGTYFTKTSSEKTLLQHPPKINDKIIGKSEATSCVKAPKKVGLSIYCLA